MSETTANPNLISRLQKVLALTTSPVEGEAQAAAEMLQKLLTDHNLSIADLEKRGQASPGVRQQGYDLGKAAFKWKLNLATVVADHYFCYALVDTKGKTVAFVGRPDNVESLQMLYGWLIDQIKRISKDEWRKHLAETGEFIDKLRWHVNFGLGAVERLETRLDALKAQQASDNDTMALVVHHQAEISDWLEEQFGYRVDGQRTKAQKEADERNAKWYAEWQERNAKREARKAELIAAGDLETLYREFPSEDPKVKEREAKENEAYWKKDAARRRANKRARERYYEQHGHGGRDYEFNEETYRKEDEAYRVKQIGKKAADNVNLQPFINGGPVPTDNPKLK